MLRRRTPQRNRDCVLRRLATRGIVQLSSVTKSRNGASSLCSVTIAIDFTMIRQKDRGRERERCSRDAIAIKASITVDAEQ